MKFKTNSVQARKQRKALYEAPLHKRNKLMSATLSEELREKYGTRSMPVRKGDVVEIMRGDFAKHKGRVEKVDLSRVRIFVEKATIKRSDGSEKFYPVHPSNVRITKLDTSDEKRFKHLEVREEKEAAKEKAEAEHKEEGRKEKAKKEKPEKKTRKPKKEKPKVKKVKKARKAEKKAKKKAKR